MPICVAQPSRLAWLMACVSDKREQIAGLLRRMGGLGMPGAMKPAIFRKFLDMLGEVATIHGEENRLIGRIEAIEQKHRFMRKHKRLKPALPVARTGLLRLPQQETPEDKAKRAFREFRWALVLWLVVLWNLFPTYKINQKKQGLTAN